MSGNEIVQYTSKLKGGCSAFPNFQLKFTSNGRGPWVCNPLGAGNRPETFLPQW